MVKCDKCKKKVEAFAKYNDKLYFYWCKCTPNKTLFNLKKVEEPVKEEKKTKKKTNKSKGPCWKGYEMVGTKTKRGKSVPNCVPKNKGK